MRTTSLALASVCGSLLVVCLPSGCQQPVDDEVAPRLGEAEEALTCVTVQRAVFGSVSDTEIQEDIPNQPSGTKTFARAGSTSSVARKHALFQFDLSFIPQGSPVQSATMNLYQAGANGTHTVGVHVVQAPWSEATLTWNAFGGAFDPNLVASFANGGPGTVGPVSIDLTTTTQQWVDGVLSNHGVLLNRSAPVNGSTSTFFYTSERAPAFQPSLTVCYDPATCSDGLQNQGEQGIDCGGPCPACPCVPGAQQSCYSGPSGTQGVGACAAGTQTCDAFGSFGPCVGEVTPQPEDCSTPTQEACVLGCGDHVFSAAWGDAFHAHAATTFAPDPQGNIVLGGYFAGSMTFGPGQGLIGPSASLSVYNGFIVKLDAQGGYLWGRKFGGSTGIQAVADIAIEGSSGDVVVTGTVMGTVDLGGGPVTALNEDVFVARYDSAGNYLWGKVFGDLNTNQDGRRVAIGAQGDVYFAATVQGTIDVGGGVLTSAGSVDVLVAKLDANGNHLWSHMYGGTAGDEVYGFKVDAQDNLVLGGTFRNTADFGGGPYTASGLQGYVLKLDPNGAYVWSKFLRSDAPSYTGTTTAYDLATMPNGDVVVMGQFEYDINLGGSTLIITDPTWSYGSYLVRFDAAGNHVWSAGYQAPFVKMEVTPSEEIVVHGATYITNWSPDYGGGVLPIGSVLAKYDANGAYQWARQLPTSSNDLALWGSDRVWLGGQLGGTVDFGGGPLTGGPIFTTVYAALLAY